MTTKLSTSNLSAETLAAISGPRISNVQIADSAYNTLDDTAANIGGGYIVINGQSFNSAAQVLIDQTPATTVTWVSNSLIRAQVPASTDGASKSVYVINPDGSLALLVNGLTYSAFPAWSTGSTLTSFEALVPVSIQLSAPSANNYTLAASNTLPSSVTLYANGLIAGTVAANTTTNYNFTVIAKDAENQDTSRSFTLPITKNNEPAWVTAADLGSAFVDANYSNTLVATDLSNVTYSVAVGSSLPSSLTLAANGFLSGSVSAANTYSFGIVATDTANLSNTRTFTITIAVANDTYFKNTTLLLNGEANVTPFIADASTNSLALTINGDTKPVLFNPYQEGYYSNFFDGAGDYLTPPLLNFGTTDFTVEAWVCPTTAGDGSSSQILYISTGATTRLAFRLNSANKMDLYLNAVTPGVTTYTSNTVLVTNGWYHLAAVRQSGSIKLFVNGILDNTPSASVHDINQNDVYTYIGSIGASTQPFTGYISNFRITNTAVYTATFTPPTSPLTAISGTRLLTCQSNRFIDNSSNAYTIAKAGDVLISPAIPFTQNASYSTYGSTYFDGTGDYITTSSSSGLAFGTGDFTIECWVYLAASSDANASFFTSTPATTYNGVMMGKDVIGISGPGGSGGNLTGVTMPVSTWTHVALTRSGTSMRVFFNGVQQGSTATNSTNINSTLGTIGSRYVEATGYLWTGYISDLRVLKGTALYTTTFTPPTSLLTAIANTSLLTLQYNGGAKNQGIIDNSNFNNIVTRNGNTSQGTFSPYSVTGWSNYFDGTGDYLSVDSTGTALNSGTSNCTYETWVYFNSVATTTGAIFTGSNSAGDSTNCIALFLANTGILLLYGPSATNTAQCNVVANRWYHVAVTRSTNTFTLWLDGVSQGSFTDSGSISYSATKPLSLGRFGAYAGYYLNGFLSNMRIINGTALYTSTFTPSTTPLTAISGTSLLTCQSNRFIDNGPNNLTITKNGDTSVQAFSPFGSISEATPLSYSISSVNGSNYVDVSSSSNIAFGSGDYTMEWYTYLTTDQSHSPYMWDFRSAGGAGTQYAYFGSATGLITNYGTFTIPSILNTWRHWAITRSGTTWRLFIDGTEIYSSTDSSTYTSSGTYRFGLRYAAESSSLIGLVSNLRFVKGQALYTGSFTPSTTPLTKTTVGSTGAGAAGSLTGTVVVLTLNSTTIVDSSAIPATITSSDVKPNRNNPFGYTAQSSTSYTPTTHGGSAYFDGTGDYLSIPYNSIFNFGTSNFTIEFWVYFNSIASAASLYVPYSSTYGQIAIVTGQATPGTLYCFLGTAANTWDIPVGGAGLTIGTVKVSNWYHVSVVRNGSIFSTYLNGTAGGTATSASALYSLSSTIYIGYDPTIPGGYLNGYMSDLRITKGTAVYTSNFVPPTQTLGNYSTTYPSSLLLNFNNGGIIDQHGTNVLETVGNAQLSTAVKKYGSSSMSFDGTGDYLSILSSPNLNFGTGDFTIESWLYPTSISATASYIFDQRTADSQNVLLAYILPERTIEIYVNGGVVVSGGTIALNSWSHFAITRASNSLKMFLNGTQIGSTYSLTNTLITAPMYIGTRYSGTQYFNGYMDDFRVTKGVARYTTTFTPPTSSFITK